jgi:hypothetical protein
VGYGDPLSKSVKRTAEFENRKGTFFQPSASRTSNKQTPFPSAKALGYLHSVRFADAEEDTLQQSPLLPLRDSPNILCECTQGSQTRLGLNYKRCFAAC